MRRLFVMATLALPFVSAESQLVRTAEQFYLPASHNWVFRRTYPEADRLFNAFDYGHAILYEKLWTRPGAPVSDLEEREFAYITRELLVKPPRLPLAEAAIEPQYAKLAPEAKHMFDWAHLLHRQVYDIWADDRLAPDAKDRAVAQVLRYYKSRPDLAFSSKPKSMNLMVGRPYSTVFAARYPKFNGLIWSYHWLQMALYEPMLVETTPEARRAGVRKVVARFRAMVERNALPAVMPMTPAISPVFAARYPELAIIFDNLHSMHDVVSDILLSDTVPRAKKHAMLLTAGREYRDDVTEVTSVAEYLEMSRMMGVDQMGGPALPGATPPAEGSMAAMHAMHHPGMAAMTPKDTASAAAAASPSTAPAAARSAAINDSAFAQLQERGKGVMGVDQYTSQHRFVDLPDGGTVTLVRDSTDAAGVATIRAHLREVRDRVAKGDFSLSEQTHAATDIPGTALLKRKATALRVTYRDLPGGGEVRLASDDAEVVAAIREFLAYQRGEHRTGHHE